MSIRKRPSKKSKNGYTYQVYFPYVNSSGIRCVYRKGGFPDKKSAHEFETKKKAEIVNYGVLFVDDNKTLDEVYKDAMSISSNTLAQATKTYYEFTYKNHIKDKLGKRKMISLTYRDIQNVINADGKSYPTAKNIKKVLNLIYKYALRQGIVKENIVRLTTIDAKNEEDSESRNISEEQINKVLEEIVKHSKYGPKCYDSEWLNRNYCVAIVIGKYTGLRVSEVLALEKTDFDFENNTIDICKRLEHHGLKKEELHSTTVLKTANSKAVIPLVGPLKQEMIKWFDITPFEHVIADQDGNYISPSTMNSRFQYVSKKLGFRFTFHMLRHFYSSKLEEMHLDPEERKNLLRHSQIEMTSKYTHMNIEQKKKAAFIAFSDEMEDIDGEDNN